MTTPAPETDAIEFEIGGGQQDALFSVLSHQYRRFVLRYLSTVETPLSVDELTTGLATWEKQRTDGNRLSGDRDDIEIALVHNHLPKMTEAGIISHDTAQKAVVLADRADEAEAHL